MTLTETQGDGASRRAAGKRVRSQATRSRSATAAAAALPLADRDRYELVREHARGGLGRIMEAHDRRLGRTVAIKQLLRRGRTAEVRFVREALITARLEHPCIVPVHDVGRWPDGELFYAMKMITGKPLKALISEKKSLAERLALLPHVIAVAEAIAYAHSQGIIHRDLKPSNVIIGEYGETVVIDWGLAKDLSAEPDAEADPFADPFGALVAHAVTAIGSVIGTPAYMPPEQARGKTVDERADVYALGALLYHCLSGHPPYEGKSGKALLVRAVREAPPRLETWVPETPEDLLAIVTKAMARNPDARYSSADELVADLKRFRDGQVVAARPRGWRHGLRRWTKRRRRALGTAALVALALVALVLGAVLARQGPTNHGQASAAAERAVTTFRALGNSSRYFVYSIATSRDWPAYRQERFRISRR